MATNSLKGKIGVTTENIFPVIKQFLYSDHEIFLRELVANAVDASQKMKALASSGDFKGELGDLKVEVSLDEGKKVLKIKVAELSTDPQLMGALGAAEFARQKGLAAAGETGRG